MAEKVKLASELEGSDGMPGTGYCKKVATVYKLSNGRFELETCIRWGSNQGYLEEHGRDQRRYRAVSLQELLSVGISESRNDEKMNDPELLQAIRSAIFEAEDSEG